MLGLVKDFNREVRTDMNESNKFFALESAVLYEFLDQARPLVDRRKKMAYLFDFPKRRIEDLEELVKNGLPLRLAQYFYFQIEIAAKRRVYFEVVKSRIMNSMLAQVRAKYRGEESRRVDENQIELESSRELTDLWRDSVEHQAAM